MRKRQRYERTVVATVNGYEIERLRVGACVYWHAIKCDAEGYLIDAGRNLGTRRAAEAYANNPQPGTSREP